MGIWILQKALPPPKKTAVNSHSALLGGLGFFGVKFLPSKKKRSHGLGARPSGGWPNPNPPFAPHFAPAGTLAVSDLDPHSVVLHLSLVLTPWRLGMDSKWNELSASWWFTNFGPNGLRCNNFVCHVFSPMLRSEEKKPAIDKFYTFVCRTSFSMAGSSRNAALHLHLRWVHLGATSDLAFKLEDDLNQQGKMDVPSPNHYACVLKIGTDHCKRKWIIFGCCGVLWVGWPLVNTTYLELTRLFWA